jgi:hypothetical protein
VVYDHIPGELFSLTLRNWMIGFYISEFELRGADRATYGDNLLSELAKRLSRLNISNCNRRQLYRYMRFYRLYPGIVGTLSPQLKKLLPIETVSLQKVGTLSPQLEIPPKSDALRSAISTYWSLHLPWKYRNSRLGGGCYYRQECIKRLCTLCTCAQRSFHR